uniref:TVA4 protein n=1 Tax=Dromaius novaehollandiae TaxID=8790 RepID=A0A8C4P8U9_DRONO
MAPPSPPFLSLLHPSHKAQVQQEPSAETTEGTGINITCSHPNIRSYEYIYWYRQLPGRAQPPKLLLQVGKWKPQAESGRFSSSLSVENSLKERQDRKNEKGGKEKEVPGEKRWPVPVGDRKVDE